MRKITAIFVLFGAACTTFQVQHAAPASVVSTTKPRNVQLSLRDGTKVEVFDAIVVRDSIVGHSMPARNRQAQRRAVAVIDVSGVATQKLQPLESILAAGFATMVLLVFLTFRTPSF